MCLCVSKKRPIYYLLVTKPFFIAKIFKILRGAFL